MRLGRGGGFGSALADPPRGARASTAKAARHSAFCAGRRRPR